MKRFLSIMLAVMIVLSSVSFAAPSVNLTFDNAADFVAAAYAPDYDATLSADTWTDSEKGIKLFVIDLDVDGYTTNTSDLAKLNQRIDAHNDNNEANGLFVSQLGRINPSVDATEAATFKISFKDGGTPTIEGSEDKYFKLSSGQPSVMLANIDVGIGTYTYEFTYNTNTSVFGVHGDASTIKDGTITQEPVDDTWTQFSYVVDATSESWIRFRPTTSSSSNWCIDDIVVYYKPEGWTPPSDEEDDDEEEKPVNKWIHDEYGELVFDIGFDKDNSGADVVSSAVSSMQNNNHNVAISSIGKINPKYSSVSSAWSIYAYTFNAGSATLSSDTEHGKFLTAVAGRSDASIYIEANNDINRDVNSPSFLGEGKYTVVFDYKVSNATSISVNHRFNGVTTADNVGTVDSWNTSVASSADNVASGCMRLRMVTPATGATLNFDNIKLYYKPEGWTPPSDDEEEEGDEEDDEKDETTDAWYDLAKGTLLFNMDFESDNGSNAVSASAYDGVSIGSWTSGAGELVSGLGRINPDVKEDYRLSFRYTTSGTAALGDDGDKYLSLNAIAENQVSLYLENPIKKTGTYTLEYDYKFVKAAGSSAGFQQVQVQTPSFANNLDTNVKIGEWDTKSVTFTVSSVPNYLRLMFQTGTDKFTAEDKFYIDNVKVYYYDPSVDYNDKVQGSGNEDDDDDEPEVSYKWIHDVYGTKLFSINFDTKIDGSAVTANDLVGIDNGRLDNSATAGIPISAVGMVNPTLPDSETSDYRVSVKDLSAFNIVKDGDRQYLSIKSTTEKPCIMLGGYSDKDGDYTIVFNYRFLDNGSGYSHSRFYMHTHSKNVSESLIAKNGEWTVTPYSYCSTDNDAYKTNYMRCVLYASNGSTTVLTGVEEYHIDEIAVYYKAKDYVTVTLDANGNENASDVVVSDVSVGGIYVKDLIARITNNSQKQLLGLSKTKDGEVLSIGEKLVLNTGDTLYMKWGNTLADKEITWTDSEKGYLLFDMDFETDKQFVKNGDKLSLYGNVNSGIINSSEWYMTINYYKDLVPGTGTATYEPAEVDIGYEFADSKYNKYLVVKPDGSSRWPQLGLIGYPSSSSSNYMVFGGANGIYTIEYDVRALLASNSNYKYTSTVVDMATFDASTGKYPTQTQGPAVATATKKDGTWEHLSGTLNDKTYDGLSRIKPCNQYPENPVATGDEFHFDNFKLYWKPFEVTATIDNSANPFAENISIKLSTESPVTVGDLKAYVKSAGLMQLKGISKVKGGVILSDSTPIDFFGDLNFYAVWEEKDMTGWTDANYGVLICELDFNNAQSFTSNSKASGYGRVNPNLSGSADWTVSSNGFSNVFVDEVSGNKYLALAVGDETKTPEFSVSAESASEFVFTSGGIYMLVYDAKLVSNDNFATNTFSAMSAVSTGATKSDEGWTTRNVRSDLRVTDKTALSEWATYIGNVDALKYDGVSELGIRLAYSSANPVSDKETLYIDNVRVFWKPDQVMLTIDPGENKIVETKKIPVSTSGVAVSDIVSKLVDHGDMKLRGISLTKNGQPLTGTLNITSDTKVYALWDELGEVIPEFSVEFEYDESSGHDIIWSNQGTNVDKNTGNGYSRHKDGYAMFVFNAAKEHSAVWDSNIQLTPFVNGNVPAGTIKGIMIRARYKNIPKFDCACATSIDKHVHEYKTDKTNTYDNAKQMFQMYYATTETTSLNEAQSVKFSYSLAEGSPYADGWFTLYADVSSKADFQEKIIDYVRLDFNNDVWDGTGIDIDYIRFIGDKSKAPSTKQEASMRTTKPMGIRFMASIKKEIVQNATAYGWVIARNASLKSADIVVSEFTYEAAVENSIPVLRGCNYGEGREEALVYSEDAVNIYFAALLYNIPDNMYEDVLVARPFAVVDDVAYYGSPISKSIYEVAVGLKKGGFKGCTAAQQTYIQRVIDKVEKA